ncbi:MAG TPA: nucleotide exchange factor GrpE [Bacillota bacterium]|nr:nucleotide exchange factor GrpE [Bacillota bacterium]
MAKDITNENLQENDDEQPENSVEDTKVETTSEDINNEQENIEVVNDEDETTSDDPSDEMKIKQLEEALEKVTQEKAELYDRMARTQAEYENFKRRTLKERSEERKYKAESLANELLPVLDNFERALQVETTEGNKQLYEGISMVYNQFKEALASQGIEEIEAEGKPFDPNLHHAVMQVEEASEESNIVLEQLQKGYKLNDRVIRPTMVKVNK